MANWLASEPPQTHRELIALARTAAARQRAFGVVSVVLAALFILVTLIEVLVGDLGIWEGMLLILGGGFAAVVTAYTTYTSGINLSLGAARLALALDDELEQEDGPDLPRHL